MSLNIKDFLPKASGEKSSSSNQMRRQPPGGTLKVSKSPPISPIFLSENSSFRHMQVKNEKEGKRAFGRVLQQSGNSVALSSSHLHDKRTSFRPNPHDRLWNPSPSKKSKSSSSSNRVVLGERKVEEVLKEEESQRKPEKIQKWTTLRKERSSDDNGKENAAAAATSKYFPNISVLKPTSDLNNSFTEKISNLNLDLGSMLGPDLNNSSSAPTATATLPSPVSNLIANSLSSPSTCAKCSEYWHEHTDPDYPYITEILNHWHSLESSHQVSPSYMAKQKEISWKMRTILVDWLVEVVEEYSIGSATLHRCVQFLDRFLSKLHISRCNLQLLGTACLFIACKVEEISPPETSDLIYITDNTYDKTQLLQMETLVLSVLDFDLLTPIPYEFAEYFCATLHLSPTTTQFTFYVLELTLLQGEKFLQFPPSVIASAGICVAIHCCGDSSHQYECPHSNHHQQKKNNKVKGHPQDQLSIPSILGRVQRLNPTREFFEQVEQAVSLLFVVVLSVSSYSSSSEAEASSSNSVCAKYGKFQDQKYFRAATAAAACFPLTWHSSLIPN